MPDSRHNFTLTQLDFLRQLNALRNLPAGIHLEADGSISVNVEELQAGMKPVVVNHPNGVIRVNECGAFFESKDGDVYSFWRDGIVETKLVNVKRVEVAQGVQLEFHVQIPLNHGTEYRWSFLPHGSLRLIYDAADVLDEVEIRGLVTHQSKDGTLTVVQIAPGNKVVK